MKRIETDTPRLLDSLLEILSNLPADSPLWQSTIPEFHRRLTELMAARQRESEEIDRRANETAARRALLRQQLQTLALLPQEVLAFFAIDDCRSWAAEQIAAEELEAVEETVGNLAATLRKYHVLSQRSRHSFLEKQSLRSEIELLEKQIALDLDYIQSKFPPAAGPGTLAKRTTGKKQTDPALRPRRVASAAGEGAPIRPTPEAQPPAAQGQDGRPIDGTKEASAALPAEPTDAMTAPPVDSPAPEGHELGNAATRHEPATTNEAAALVAEVEEPVAAPAPEDVALPQAIDESEPAQAQPQTPDPTVPGVSAPPVEPQPPTAEAEPAPADAQPHPIATDWSQKMWALINAGDVAAAYWLARAIEAVSEAPTAPLPAWLVAAIQGAWWRSSVKGTLDQDLAAISTAHTPDPEPNARLAALSAALAPTLVAPAANLGAWLESDPLLPPRVNEIIAAVVEFSRFGQPLSRYDILAIRGEDRREQILDVLVKAAAQWLQEAPQRKTKFGEANSVWAKWTKPNGLLYQMVEVVAKNEPRRIKELQGQVDRWRVHDNDYWLDQTHAEVMGVVNRHRIRPIQASPRARLLEQAEEAVGLAEQWLEIRGAANRTSEWSQERIRQLIDTIEAAKGEAAAALQAMESAAADGPLSPPVVRLLRWSLADLCAVLELEPPAVVLPERKIAQFPQGIETTLKDGLAFRLFLLPELDLPDDLEIAAAHTRPIAQQLADATADHHSLEQAFEGWVKAQDFRFTPTILQNLEGVLDEATLSALHDRHRQAQSQAQTQLTHRVAQTRDAIEQAMVDGLIGEAERAEFTARLESIEKLGQANNYAARRRQLDQIESTLNAARQTHWLHQKDRWQAVHQRMQQANVEPQLVARITEFLEEALANKDIVVVDERLARLEEIIDGGQAFEAGEFDVDAGRDVYQEFVDILPLWEEQYNPRTFLRQISLSISRSGTHELVMPPGLTLPKPRVEEVVEALRSWQRLIDLLPSARKEVADEVTRILRYLGYTFTTRAGQAVDWRESSSAWAHLTVHMTAGNLSPIPQFGSMQRAAQNVVCVWERPGADVVQSIINRLQLGNSNVLVLFLGRLNPRQRRDLMRAARKDSTAWAILDEFLLLFLIRETDSRLRTFLRCALPLSGINPYVETGPVAPEMFFGRADERKSLQTPEGIALVFGGRQLGKSALLQQVEREFHSPEQDRFVIRRDVKMLGDPTGNRGDPELIWADLRSELEQKELLEKSTATTADTVVAQIRRMMELHPRRQVLVLLDEADNFLAADMKRNFEVVSRLKALMDDTARRFKVVFVGLHNVQRYEGIPNQPLAHLPRLPVGPLEPFSARQLIAQPLEALGFRFPKDDESPILGILAYTNYHPGLIQLFCQKLLQNLQRRVPPALGPFEVTREDVEKIYRQREVQDGIRRRFEWTLALDPRYKALAQIIVLDQMQDRDGYSKTYALDDMQQLAAGLWSQAFQNASRDEFRGYLDEMAGLGVLVRNDKNEYRLRSPNLVRLMGSEEDLWGSLQELTRKPVDRTLVPDSHHASFDETTPCRYSPFTYSQARALNGQGYGVGLVFGSPALGVDLVSEALKKHFIPQGGSGKVQEISGASLSGEALERWLRGFLDRYQEQERLIVYRFARGTAADIKEQIEASLTFARRHKRSQRQWMRIVFIFDTPATWEWLSLPPAERDTIENQVDAGPTLGLWDSEGVAQRLRQHDKLETTRVINTLMSDLGGWPYLLDSLADRWGNSDDPLPVCQAMRRELMAPNSALATKFLAATGLGVNSRIEHVLQVIAEAGAVPEELLVPGILGEALSPALSEHECYAIVEYLRLMSLLQVQTSDQGREMVVQPVVKELLQAGHVP